MTKSEKVWLISQYGDCMEVPSKKDESGNRFVYIHRIKYQVQYHDYFSDHAQLSIGFISLGGVRYFTAKSVMNCFLAR